MSSSRSRDGVRALCCCAFQVYIPLSCSRRSSGDSYLHQTLHALNLPGCREAVIKSAVFSIGRKVMKATQYKWSQSGGWKPDLPTSEADQQDVVFIFGARPLIQAGQAIDELRSRFKGAAIIGCSTSG